MPFLAANNPEAVEGKMRAAGILEAELFLRRFECFTLGDLRLRVELGNREERRVDRMEAIVPVEQGDELGLIDDEIFPDLNEAKGEAFGRSLGVEQGESDRGMSLRKPENFGVLLHERENALL